ncbi:MAG: DUF501 domain-containing protein [Ilumatobacteraceae bacterium]
MPVISLPAADGAGPPNSDFDRVRELLGREPQGRFEIVVRDGNDDPVVLRNDPLLDDGTPMQTRYWLISRSLVAAVGRLEAAGGVRQAEREISAAEIAAAHARYRAERDAALPVDYNGPTPSGGVAGTREGVKCLHAHYGWYLAGGDDPVGRWVAERIGEYTKDSDPMVAPSRCVVVETE